MPIMSVNFISILVAAAAAWILGAIYYRLLRDAWLAAQGKTLESCRAEQAGKSKLQMLAPLALVFVGTFIMAWVLYGIMRHVGMFTVRAGMISGAFVWFGFVLTSMSVNNAFQGKRAMLTVIDAGYWLLSLLLIGAILGGWG
jgi:hypothetical protein